MEFTPSGNASFPLLSSTLSINHTLYANTINDTLASNAEEVDGTTKKYDTVYLADDASLDGIPEFVAANYIDYVYAPICASLGIVGNFLAFCVLVTSTARSRGCSTYVYMASLSVSDMLVQVVNILFLVRKFPGHETLKEGTCGFVFFLLYFSIHYNVVVMVTMTLERFLAIRFPLKAVQWFSIGKARVVVIVQAVLVFILNAQHLILRGMVYNEKAGEYQCMPIGESTEFYLFKVWPWIDGVIYCYAPLFCLVVFNYLILKQVRSSRSFQSQNDTARQQPGPGDKDQAKTVDKEAQLTRMLLLVTTAFLVFVSPMAVIIVVERNFWFPDTSLEKAQYHLVRTVFNNLSYTNHALNFLLYCFSGRRFRQELRMTFSCLCPGSGSTKTGRTSASGDRNRACESFSREISVQSTVVSE